MENDEEETLTKTRFVRFLHRQGDHNFCHLINSLFMLRAEYQSVLTYLGSE